MAKKGTHELGPNRITTAAEHNRRESAVNYARASVVLEGLVLSASDEVHAQRFINGGISLGEFAHPRPDALAHPKSSS